MYTYHTNLDRESISENTLGLGFRVVNTTVT